MTTTTTTTSGGAPSGGSMMDLTRDERGRIRATPSGVSYFDTIIAESGPWPGMLPSDGASDASDSASGGQTWRIWRTTDAEDGAAPDFEEIDRALWFGKELAGNTDACAAAWRYLQRLISNEKRGYPGCHLARTPGATGLMLIMHSLPWGKNQPRPYAYPTLDAPTARLLAAVAPQHRQEITAIPGTLMRRYAVYDARVAHLAYLRHLPVSLGAECATGPIHDDGSYVPHRAGKYRCAVTIPAGWRHIGLVHRAAGDGVRWEWPAAPGEEWECWLDECEVRLLADHGWPHAVRERVLFAAQNEPGGDPLREHQQRLAREIERLDALVRGGNRTPAIQAARHALRAIALHPIGLWHKSENKRTRHIASADELTPDDADADLTPDGAGGYTVTTRAELSAWQAHWRRPEWSTTIYARERVQATRRALTLRRDQVCGIRGDAVHIVNPDPGALDTTDDGRVGSYRLDVAYSLPRERRVPASMRELTALHAQACAVQKPRTGA